MKTRTLRLSALFTAAALTATGCTSVADMMGYDTATLNASAGFLIHPFAVAGVAVLISAGRRVAAVWKPAALGAVVGIAVRTIGHALL